MHTINDIGNEEGEKILNILSKNLKEDVVKNYFSKVLLQTKLFKLNFSKECLIHTSQSMKEIMFAPGEIIYRQGDLDDKVYIIRQGSVELFLE